MIETALFEALQEAFDYNSKELFKEAVIDHLKDHSDEQTSKDLAEFFYRVYNSSNGPYIGIFMELAIEINPALALLKQEENFFFRLIIIKGSKDLYDCYIEHAIAPFLKDKNEDDSVDYYTDLLILAIKINDFFTPQLAACIKGMDYNGAFADSEVDPNVCLIHKEDYVIMSDVVEKYNTLIGRREIIKDLEERCEYIDA